MGKEGGCLLSCLFCGLSGIKRLVDFLFRITQWPTMLELLLGGINSYAASFHWLCFLTGDCSTGRTLIPGKCSF